MGERMSDFCSGGHGGEGSAVSDGFGHDDDIWLHLLPLESPGFLADPAETRLHLIRNIQPAHFFDQFVHSLHIGLLEGDDTARSHHWLKP